MISKITIHESEMGLKNLEAKILKYLNRKKAQEPQQAGDGTLYMLRNGLAITIYPVNGNNTLRMNVIGDIDRINKSVEAVRGFYSGEIDISYLKK